MIAVQCRAKQANNRRTSKHASKLGSKQSVHFVACQHAQPTNSDTLSRILTHLHCCKCRELRPPPPPPLLHLSRHRKPPKSYEKGGTWVVAVASYHLKSGVDVYRMLAETPILLHNPEDLQSLCTCNPQTQEFRRTGLLRFIGAVS